MKRIISLCLCTLAVTLTASGREPDSPVIRTDVPNKAFYKDMFNDDGVGVAPNRGNLPAFRYMASKGFTYEYTETPDKANYVSSLSKVQDEARIAMLKYYVGSEYDSNGYLLYPDGEPRYRIIYVNGGYENTHSAAWTAQGRENIRTFFHNGGSYTGSCCGSLLCTYRNQPGWTHSGQAPVTMTVGLWPGFPQGMAGNFHSSFDVPEDSPLMRYNDSFFNFDGHVDSCRHANGPFFPNPEQVPGTEVLGVYTDPDHSGNGYPCAIAYKPSIYTGRVTVCGSHPETTTGSECLFFQTSLFRYAMDGVGIAKVKGILHNGEVRNMTKSTEDRDPAFTKVGDRQCHNFAFALPAGAKNIRVRLESLKGFKLSLRMAQGTFAFKEDAQYAVENTESVKELRFKTLPEGTWYVGVQCEETVGTDVDIYGTIYTGNLAVLNGAPYRISVTWDAKGEKKAAPTEISGSPAVTEGRAVLMQGVDFNEFLKRMASDVIEQRSKDSLIRKIVFKTGDATVGQIRVDDPSSEVPAYASFDMATGVITVNTPADVIHTGSNASALFETMTALESIENLAALNTSEAKTFYRMFNGCSSMKSVDITSFSTENLVDARYLFTAMTSCERIDCSSLDVTRLATPRSLDRMFFNLPALKEIRFGAVGEHSAPFRPSYFFASEKEKFEDRTGAANGLITVYCTAQAAEWLADTQMRWIVTGKGDKPSVAVEFRDFRDPSVKYSPKWAED